LLDSFRRSCKRLGYRSVIVGTDITENSAALQCCDRKYIVKAVSDRAYPRQVMDIIRREKVDLVIPTIDLDLPIWAGRRVRLARMGCTALISNSKVVDICQDKRLTFRFLKKHGFDTPDTISAAHALRLKKPKFPYFLKPWDGHASRGNAIARNRQELRFFARRIPNCLVQELIKGQEHTVDLLVDFEGAVRCVVPRLRMRTRGGEVSKSRTVKHARMIAQSKKLIETLGAGPGIITIQCFLTGQDTIKFNEINPRFGGGIPLSIKAGADFPRWILQMWFGQKPRISLTGWQDSLTMLRYDEAVWYQK